MHWRVKTGALAWAFVLLGGLAAAQAAQAESTEREMRAAIEAKFGNVNANANSLAERCNNREYQRSGDQMLAMQCLQYAIAGGVTNGGSDVRAPQFNITRFEKIACEKAHGKPGYLCDYVMGYGSNMAANSPMLEGTMRNGAAAQARFIKRDGGWIALDS